MLFSLQPCHAHHCYSLDGGIINIRQRERGLQLPGSLGVILFLASVTEFPWSDIIFGRPQQEGVKI